MKIITAHNNQFQLDGWQNNVQDRLWVKVTKKLTLCLYEPYLVTIVSLSLDNAQSKALPVVEDDELRVRAAPLE